MTRYKDITGQRSGRLTAVRYAGGNAAKNNASLWECLCDCGTRKVIEGKSLSGKSSVKSCGCLLAEHCQKIAKARKPHSKHGHAANKTWSPEYVTWLSMRQRCLQPSNTSYAAYGGKGIKVCPEWERSFTKFFEDMGKKPYPKASIDRKNCFGDYTPDNCRWASCEEQANNKANSVRATYCGVVFTAKQLAEIHNISTRTLYNWIKVAGSGCDLTEKINGAKH